MYSMLVQRFTRQWHAVLTNSGNNEQCKYKGRVLLSSFACVVSWQSAHHSRLPCSLSAQADIHLSKYWYTLYTSEKTFKNDKKYRNA